MVNYKTKYIISLLILLGLALACTRADKDKQNTQKQQQQQAKDTVKINKDQYRVAEIFQTAKPDNRFDTGSLHLK
jgi:ABC-type Fe3+-citrate transport system substrate-binding protein